jgi:hypothetical protein
VAGSCKHINEPSGSIKSGKFLEYLREYYLLKKSPLLNEVIFTSGGQQSIFYLYLGHFVSRLNFVMK